MLAIFDKIRRPATDAADLRQRLTEVAETLPQLEAEVRRHQQRRAEGLLSLSDREVEKIEAELALALRNRDRANAAIEELERRVADAEAAEAGAELDREREAVEKRAAKLAARIRPEYERHASAIVALLIELAQVEEEVRTLNHKLGAAGRHSDVLAPVEARAIDPGGNLPELVSLVAMTSLRPVGACPGWGAASRAAGALGLKP